MSRIAATRVIAAPVELVWEVFTDLASGCSWRSDVECVKPAVRPLSVGTAWREMRRDRAGQEVTEDVVVLAIDPGRSCVLGVANVPSSPRLTYVFTPISVGPDRGATAAQIAVESERSAARRPHRLANQVLAFLVGGFAARTTEGALRAELDSLAAACADRLRARSGHRTAA